MSAPTEPRGGYQFGTFKGVFLPSILTILGVIMYLRFGWVLGHAGLPKTLLIDTILIGEAEDPAHHAQFVRFVRLVSSLGRNLVVVREPKEPPRGGFRSTVFDLGLTAVMRTEGKGET